jgi:hypothetical protein
MEIIMSDKKISELANATTPLAGTEVVPVVQSGSTTKVSVDNLTAGKAVSALSLTATNIKTSPTTANLDISGSTIQATGSASSIDINISPKGAAGLILNNKSIGGISNVVFNNGRSIQSNTPNDFELTLQSGATSKNTLVLTDSGDVKANVGNLVIGTAGKGIDFSADGQAAGMTSELLDDYEEGTFTPVAAGSTDAGTATYTTQLGRYTKIGNRVFFNLRVSWTGHTGTGDLLVGGLPFTSNSTAANHNPASIIGIGLDFSNTLAAYVLNNTSNITITSFATAAAVSNVAVDAAATLIITGNYAV